jgi:hypothetical protein
MKLESPVWCVFAYVTNEGAELLGIYTTEEKAKSVVEEWENRSPRDNYSIYHEAISLDSPLIL